VNNLNAEEDQTEPSDFGANDLISQAESSYDPDYDYDNDNGQERNNADYETGGEDSDHGPSGDDPDADDENSFLNALRIYDRMKKSNPSLTPEELDRRRRNGTCFRCNKEGHFSSKCPLRIGGGNKPPAVSFNFNKNQKNQQ
jgi:hypothetical protein